jgi:drug/metabolite transporter (DMT)-like permease
MPPRTPPTTARSSTVRAGMLVALASAATFGSSGAAAKSLIQAGWSAGGAVLVRLAGAALVLSIAATLVHGRRWPLHAGSVRTLVIYGTVAMAGTQLAYFNAVARLDVGVALLLEFLAPVLLLAWSSLRTRSLPARTTLAGAALSLVGLTLVLDVGGATSLDPIGVGWGLVAAACLSGFFVLSKRAADELPVLVLAAGGTAVGAALLLVTGIVGIVPLRFAVLDTELAGRSVAWFVPVLWLILVATVVAYLTGIAAIARLGTRVASFVGLTEVLFAVLIAWLVLAELPGPGQLVGGACIVAGIMVIEHRERDRREVPHVAT